VSFFVDERKSSKIGSVMTASGSALPNPALKLTGGSVATLPLPPAA
jgi:hypothetical protein